MYDTIKIPLPRWKMSRTIVHVPKFTGTFTCTDKTKNLKRAPTGPKSRLKQYARSEYRKGDLNLICRYIGASYTSGLIKL